MFKFSGHFIKALLLLVIFTYSTQAFSEREILVRIDEFFSGPIHKTNDPFTLSGKIIYMGTETFESVYLNYKIGDGEVQQIFYDEIGINAYIPFYYELTNIWTPETTGQHEISLWFSGLNGEDAELASSPVLEKTIEVYDDLPARNIALLESFSSINCGSCALATPQLREIISRDSQHYKQIYYHPLRNENSPLYLFNPKDQDVRKDLYEIFYTPLSVLGASYFGGSEFVEEFLFQNELSKWAGFNISGSWYVHNDFLHWIIEGETLIDLTNTNKDFRLLIAAVQDSVGFDTPPGSNGESHFFNVMRFFAPDANGVRLNADQHRNSFIIEMSIPWITQLDKNNITLISFVQDLNSNEIYQVSTLNYQEPDFTNIDQPESHYNSVYPNPVSDNIIIANSNGNEIRLVSFFNLQGQKVKSVATSGQMINISVNDLPDGIYYVTIEMADKQETRKISILR